MYWRLTGMAIIVLLAYLCAVVCSDSLGRPLLISEILIPLKNADVFVRT